MFVALYRGESVDATVKAAQGFVTIDFLDFACRFLLNPTRDTVSPRRRGGSVEATESKREGKYFDRILKGFEAKL